MRKRISKNVLNINNIKQLEFILSEKYEKLSNDIEKSKQELEQIQNLRLYYDTLPKSNHEYLNSQSNLSKFRKNENSLLSTLNSPVKKSHLLVMASIILVIGMVFPFYETFSSSDISSSEMIKSRFVMENLRGDTIDTWKSWRIPSGVAMTVAIANLNSFDQNIIDVVKNSIKSVEQLEINDSVTHKGPKDSTSNYYLGWQGALSTTVNADTLYTIPNEFNIINSGNGEGDIIITLTNLQHDDGLSGHTKSIVSNNEILKSFITIYDVDNLNNDELSTIIRHEFGHAIGIGHSTDPADLMYDTISTDLPYISDCHIGAVTKLYNGEHASHTECEK